MIILDPSLDNLYDRVNFHPFLNPTRIALGAQIRRMIRLTQKRRSWLTNKDLPNDVDIQHLNHTTRLLVSIVRK
jgi:hypothetical protein